MFEFDKNLELIIWLCGQEIDKFRGQEYQITKFCLKVV